MFYICSKFWDIKVDNEKTDFKKCDGIYTYLVKLLWDVGSEKGASQWASG